MITCIVKQNWNGSEDSQLFTKWQLLKYFQKKLKLKDASKLKDGEVLGGLMTNKTFCESLYEILILLYLLHQTEAKSSWWGLKWKVFLEKPMKWNDPNSHMAPLNLPTSSRVNLWGAGMQKCISSGHGLIKLLLGLLAYKLGPLEVLGLANCLNKPTKEINNNKKHKKRDLLNVVTLRRWTKRPSDYSHHFGVLTEV